MRSVIELAKEAGFSEWELGTDEYRSSKQSMYCQRIKRFAALVTAEKDKEIAELYEMSVKQAKTIKEYQDAKPVKQEPVADKVLRLLEPFMPVDAKAIRAEALEEAAKFAYKMRFRSCWTAEAIADGIRGLK